MTRESPQLVVAEDKEVKQEATKARRDVEIKAGLQAARDACSIYNDLDEKKLEALCLNLVGELLLAKDDVDEAKNVARESRDICQDLEDVHGEAHALNIILSANMLHEEDFVDALFAAKDVIWLFRGPDTKPEEDEGNIKEIADALHAQAKVHLSIWELKEACKTGSDAVNYYEKACSTEKDRIHYLAPALQTVARALCADNKPDEGLPHSKKSVELFNLANDRHGEAMAKAMQSYQDSMARLRILDESPQAMTEALGKQIEENWKYIEEGLVAVQELRSLHDEEQIAAMIHHMNQKISEIQAKMGEPTKTVWTFDRATRQTVKKDYYDPISSPVTTTTVA